MIQEGGKYNEFSCFLHACDITIDGLNEIQKNKGYDANLELLRFIESYIKNRGLLDNVIKERIVALYDDGTSRRQGKAGEMKIKNILEGKGYEFVNNRDDFCNKRQSLTFVSANKGVFGVKNIKKNLNVDYQFNRDKKKSADVLVKNGQILYLLEAKHIKEGGGSQDKQFQELLDFIGYSEEAISYVGFLDGIYRNFLLKSGGEYKDTEKTRIEIITELLENNPNNYFINTYGLNQLF